MNIADQNLSESGSNMKRAIIAGSTGLVGSELLKLLLADGRYAEIYVPGRRDPGVNDARVKFITCHFDDFSRLPTSGIDEVYCALGTTIKKAGSQAAFRAVDFDAVFHLAQWAAQTGVGCFVVISSLGAKADSGNFYLRTKGEMEQVLRGIGLQMLVIVRPSLLLGNRTEVRFGERLGEWVMKPLARLLTGRLRKYRPIAARHVAMGMKHLAENNMLNVCVAESDQLQLLANGYLK